MTKKKKCYFEISASFYLLSWSFPKICLSVCQKLRIFACERKNQRWKDMELMLIRKSGSENRPLTHVDKISYLLSDKMPQDPKTVGKGERYIRTYKHSKGSTSESRRKSWYQEKYKESIINKIKSIFIEGK